MNNFNLRIIDSFDEIREEWLRLEEDAVFYYFQSFLWLSEWYKHIGVHTRSHPRIVAAYRGDRLEALFPLCVQRRYGVFRLISWMGGRLTDYNAPLFSDRLDEEERNAIVVAVIAALSKMGGVDAILFERIPGMLDNGMENPLIGTGLLPPCTHAGDDLSAPYLMLKDWNSCYAGVSKKIRKDSERSRRRLSELGDAHFSVVSDPDEVREITRIMIKQKIERLLGKGSKNMFADTMVRDFYYGAGLKMCAEERLYLCRLSLDGRVIATHWGILFNKRLYWLMPSFDSAYRNLSPGRLLMEDAIRWSCDNNVGCFDFCLGDEPYKRDWTDTQMRLHRFSRPLTFRGAVFDQAYRRVRPFLKRHKIV